MPQLPQQKGTFGPYSRDLRILIRLRLLGLLGLFLNVIKMRGRGGMSALRNPVTYVFEIINTY